jgi:hypothetical protein
MGIRIVSTQTFICEVLQRSDENKTIESMRNTAKQGARKIYMDKSHRFNCDITRILTDYIKPDMPEAIQSVVEPFSFWEEHMEAGVCIYI